MNDLSQLAEQVERLIQNQEAQLSIVVETGYDEAGLVGTKDAYLRLVKEILQFLHDAEAGTLHPLQIEGMHLPCSSDVGSLFDSRCEIGLDTTTLTKSEEETAQLVEYFFKHSPSLSRNNEVD